MNKRNNLSWRVIAAHIIVVLIGVSVILLLTQWMSAYIIPDEIHQHLGSNNMAYSQEERDALIQIFQQSILHAVGIAALAALLAGGLTTIWLSKQITNPLNQLVESSRRIANGRYDERIPSSTINELAEVSHHFNQMATALEKVENTRATLIGNISHELRTPLTSMVGYVEGMVDGVFPPNEETFAFMEKELHRLTRLVDDLQVVSKVEGGDMPLVLKRFDFVKKTEEILTELQPQLLEKKLQLETKLPSFPIFIDADPDRVTQILINLLSNAIRYTPEYGKISVQLKKKEGIELMVEDNGIGIAPESLPYIFERFYQADSSRTHEDGQGSGVGLTISRQLARAMGGDIIAQSNGLGDGTTFYLIFK